MSRDPLWPSLVTRGTFCPLHVTCARALPRPRRIPSRAARRARRGRYAYTLAEMTSLLVGQDAKIERYRRGLASVEKYLHARQIDGQTRLLVREHFRSAFENEHDNDDAILAHMPRALRVRVLRSANAKLLRVATLSRGLEEVTLDALASVMGRLIVMADELVIELGAVPLEMCARHAPQPRSLARQVECGRPTASCAAAVLPPPRPQPPKPRRAPPRPLRTGALASLAPLTLPPAARPAVPRRSTPRARPLSQVHS